MNEEEMPSAPFVPLAPPVSMTMNGEAREFRSVFGQLVQSMQLPSEPPKPMIDIQAFSDDGLNLMLWLFATTPGTYPCTTDKVAQVFMLTNDAKRFNPPVTFGGFLGTGDCAVTITQFTAPEFINQGRAVGSFHAELNLTTGDWPVKTLKLVDGHFDLPINR